MEHELVEVTTHRPRKPRRIFIRNVPLGSKVRLEDYPNEVFTYTGNLYSWFILRSSNKELLVGHYRYVEEL